MNDYKLRQKIKLFNDATVSHFYMQPEFRNFINATHHVLRRDSINSDRCSRVKTSIPFKKNKLMILNNFHRKLLKSKLLENQDYLDIEERVCNTQRDRNEENSNTIRKNNSELYLTNVQIKNTNKNTNKTTNKNRNCILNPSKTIKIPTLNLKKLDTNINIKFREKYYLPFTPNTFNIDSNTRSKRKFIEQTKCLSDLKYILKLKRDNSKKEEETNFNKTERVSQSYYELLAWQKLFNSFCSNLSSFKSNYYELRENERQNLKLLASKKECLLNDIIKLRNEINNLKIKQENGREYRDLLLLVKYRKLSIKDLPAECFKVREESSKTNLLLDLTLSNKKKKVSGSDRNKSSSKKLNYRPSVSSCDDYGRKKSKLFPNRRFTRKRSSLVNDKDDIYTKAEDFANDFENLEGDVFKKFVEFEHVQTKINELSLERSKLQKCEKKDQQLHDNEKYIQYMMLLISELKNENRFLVQKLEEYKQYTSAQKNTVVKIYEKIKKNIINLPINLVSENEEGKEIQRILSGYYFPDEPKSYDKIYFILLALSLLEKISTKLILKNNKLSSDLNIKIQIQNIKSNLEANKRLVNSRKKLLAERKRRENLKETILMKSYKTYFLPFKKVPKSYNFLKNKKRVKSNNKKLLELNDVLFY